MSLQLEIAIATLHMEKHQYNRSFNGVASGILEMEPKFCLYGLPTASLAKMGSAYGAHARARFVMPAEVSILIEQVTN